MGVEKEKALEIALSQIEKQFGKGAVMKLGDAGAKIAVSVVSTGCIELDYALGVGGIPRGRIVEIYGPESSGKTTIALHVIAQSQKLGGTAAFIDAEHALDPVYAEILGVRVDDLYVSQPDTGEQALEITEALVRSGAIDVIVVDSVAALVPKAEIEGDMGDFARGPAGAAHVAGAAQAGRRDLQIQHHRHLHQPAARKSGRHVRQSGDDDRRQGAQVLRLHPSGRAQGDPLKTALRSSATARGSRSSKTRSPPPFKTAEFDMIYGEGISREGSLLDMAVARRIIVKSGAWFFLWRHAHGAGARTMRACS